MWFIHSDGQHFLRFNDSDNFHWFSYGKWKNNAVSQSQCHSVPFQQLLLFPLVVKMQQLSRAQIRRSHSQKKKCVFKHNLVKQRMSWHYRLYFHRLAWQKSQCQIYQRVFYKFNQCWHSSFSTHAQISFPLPVPHSASNTN